MHNIMHVLHFDPKKFDMHIVKKYPSYDVI